jgi:DNA-binding response OmpR family regulator
MAEAFSSPDALILLLDSESAMRATLRDALEGAGHMVVTASDLGEAVDRLNEAAPNLLIVRPYINSMPGHVAANYLRRIQNGLPVLIVSGFMDDDRTNIRNLLQDFQTFPKPFTPDELLAEVKNVLNINRP